LDNGVLGITDYVHHLEVEVGKCGEELGEEPRTASTPRNSPIATKSSTTSG
jgi:hypothetical protein